MIQMGHTQRMLLANALIVVVTWTKTEKAVKKTVATPLWNAPLVGGALVTNPVKEA